MAKKTKAKYLGPTVAPEMSKPSMYVDLQDQDVSQLKDLAVGDKVELRVIGTIKGLSQDSRKSYDDPKKTIKTGSIRLEGYSVEVMEEESNEFSKMAEDD